MNAFVPKQNPLKEKSYAFALRVISLCKDLQKKNEFVLSKQLLKAGASIGANVEEASQAQSMSDFIAKLSISLKEAFETAYWLRLLQDSQLIPRPEATVALGEVDELKKLLTAIIKTSKAK